MTVYQYSTAPGGVVHVRGVRFVDGVSADVEVSEDTVRLFDAYGITEADTVKEPSKAELQAAAADLGLDTKGTKAEIQARIDEHQPVDSADEPKE